MNLYSKRVKDEFGENIWILYWQGELSRPIATLTDFEMRRFIEQTQKQAEAKEPTP